MPYDARAKKVCFHAVSSVTESLKLPPHFWVESPAQELEQSDEVAEVVGSD